MSDGNNLSGMTDTGDVADGRPLADVEAFFDEESRWRNALVGGLAGGVGGAVGTSVGLPLFQRILLIAAVALVVAGVLVIAVGRYDRRAESNADDDAGSVDPDDTDSDTPSS